LVSIGVVFDNYAKILFPLAESCIPEDVLRVWLRNAGASIRADGGSSIFVERTKDLVS
jgi:hypothetical protein